MCLGFDVSRRAVKVKSVTMSEGKEHLSIVICGHVDSGKSTTTARFPCSSSGVSRSANSKSSRLRPMRSVSLRSLSPFIWIAKRKSVSVV